MNRFAICLALSIVLGSASQLLLKAAAPELTSVMSQFMESDKQGEWLKPLIDMLMLHRAEVIYFLAGLLLYATAMFTWITTLQGYELAKAYPCLSMSYVLVYLGAVFMPGIQESLSLDNAAGILLIVAGIILVFRKPSDPIMRDGVGA